MQRLSQILSFFEFAEQLKSVNRRVYCSGGRPENSAEHSWHLALFVLLMHEEVKDADLCRMLKMALVHDIVEIEAGDTFEFNAEHKQTQQHREQLAAKRIFAQLPPDLEVEFADLFEEFDAGQTREAKIVRSLDKLQAVIQNVCSDGKGWKQHNLAYERVDAHKRQYMLHDPRILKLYEMVIEQAKEQKLL
jgi:putative hydrolase of HD superfamily